MLVCDVFDPALRLRALDIAAQVCSPAVPAKQEEALA